MTAVDKNNVLDVRRRPLKVKAVQFTGKNGAEIVAFINETHPELKARNGGSYVKVSWEADRNGGAGSFNARKGDWIVDDANYSLGAVPPVEFDRLFSIKG